jgi:ABC-type transport system substrate-binding protein
VFKRNPSLQERDKQKRPYVDTVEAPIMNDSAQGQAQFRAGNIWSAAGGVGLPLGVTASDVLTVKRDIPQLNLYNVGVASDPQKMVMGQHPQSAFKDKRVRQAMFLVWDRDAYIDVIFNVSKFKDGGLPIETRYASAFPCDLRGYPGGTYEGYWLDPLGKDFGPNAKFYKHDAAEAKKLLAAAGYGDGLEFDHLWSLPNSFGPGTGRAVDTINATISDAGFKPVVKNLQTPQWVDTVQTTFGNFQGVATAIDSGGPDPANYLFQHYHKDGTRFGGFNPAGTGWSKDGDPTLNDNILKMKSEFDESKRKALAAELSRYIAENGYNPRYPGGASSLAIQWPVLQNANVWIGDFPRQWANEWIDDTQPPLKK